MTDLIAWAEVPEGPVWAKKIADKRWMLFEREADGRIHDYGLLMAETTIDPQDYPLWEFAHAEQQPGEHAALLTADDERQTTCTDCPRCGDHVRTSDLRSWLVCEQTHMEPAEYEDGCINCCPREEQ